VGVNDTTKRDACSTVHLAKVWFVLRVGRSERTGGCSTAAVFALHSSTCSMLFLLLLLSLVARAGRGPLMSVDWTAI
jgi:hypothetical protein